jgi:signal peptidase II
LYFWLTLITVFLTDQFSKYLLQLNLLKNESIPVLPPVFYITYIENPGAAFGIMAHKTGFFIAISLLVVAGTLFFYRQIIKTTLLQLQVGLIVGGSLGNLLDRLRIGQVVDFLDFRIWPVFNIADTAIVIGVGLLIWDTLFHSKKHPRDGDKVVKDENN